MAGWDGWDLDRASVFLIAAACYSPATTTVRCRAGAITALLGEAVLVVGGWLGGAIVFVHGECVLALPDEPARKAVLPRSVESQPLPPLER